MDKENNNQIQIQVETSYVDEQSEPDSERFVFAYTINIQNNGLVPAKLISRHWIVTDANNKQQEVTGQGVVGKQPHLKPGESFQYTSAAVIDTPVGCMQGSYQMLADDGRYFNAPIPAFNLSKPNTLH